MPIYEFECVSCNTGETVITTSLKEDITVPTCEGCQAPMDRDYSTGSQSTTGVFHKPIKMHSIGMAHDDEIAAFRQRNPDIEVEGNPDHPDFGVPIITTREEKLRVLRTEGYEERK